MPLKSGKTRSNWRRSDATPRRPHTSHPTFVRNFVLFAVWFGVLVGSLFASESQARLEPYYIVRGASFAAVTPRVLIVLDTSGSMAWKADATNLMCKWRDCESAVGSSRSRIASAREAIRTLVNTLDEDISFGLMTFDQQRPPSASGARPRDLLGSAIQLGHLVRRRLGRLGPVGYARLSRYMATVRQQPPIPVYPLG